MHTYKVQGSVSAGLEWGTAFSVLPTEDESS